MTARSRMFRRTLWAIASIVVLLGAWASLPGPRYEREIRAELDRIRAEGWPASLEELAASYPEPPPGENAADTYLPALQRLRPSRTVKVPSRLLREMELSRTQGGKIEFERPADTLQIAGGTPIFLPAPKPDEDILPIAWQDEIKDLLLWHAQSLADLHRGAESPDCRYPFDPREVVSGFLGCHGLTGLGHLHDLEEAVALLRFEALSSAERDEAGTATQAILALVALARSLDAEPALPSQLARARILRTTAKTLDDVLDGSMLTGNCRAELLAAFEALDDTEPWLRGLAGERCLTVEVLRRSEPRFGSILLWESPPAIGGFWECAKLRASGWTPQNVRDFLQLSRPWIEAWGRHPEERDAALREAEGRLDGAVGGLAAEGMLRWYSSGREYRRCMARIAATRRRLDREVAKQ